MQNFKWFFLIVLTLFTMYTIYTSFKESIFKTAKVMFSYHWGRQVTIDLYIGFFIFGFFLLGIEDSWASTLAWFLPTLVFGNIIPLLYLVIHFEKALSIFQF